MSLAAFAAVIPAGPAGAHAVLTSSEPADRQVLPTSPKRLVLRFSESVAVSSDSVRLLDHHGEVVVKRGAAHARGDDATVVLPLPALDHGAYVVAWRVVSADSHPVAGAFTLRVGGADEDFHVGAGLFAAPRGSRLVGAVFGVVRFAAFSSLLVLVGAISFLMVVWPGGIARSGPRRLVRIAVMAAGASTVAAVALQGPYGSGGRLAEAVSPSVVGEVLDTRFGHAGMARLALLGALAVVLAWVVRREAPPAGLPAVAGITVLLATILATLGLAGHATTGRWASLALPMDVVHLAAVSLWLGGLVMLFAFVLRGQSSDQARPIVSRFSALAFWVVVVIVVTGSFQSWRQLGGIDELTTTAFGRLLVAKLTLVAALLAIARVSRRRVHPRTRAPVAAASMGPGTVARDDEAASMRALRRSVGAEVALAVAVVGVTALLVNAVPARSASKLAGPALPFTTEMVKDDLKVSLTMEPARPGLNDLHVYLSSAGQVRDVLELGATLRLPADDTGPLEVPLVKNAPGHYSAFGFQVPIAGTWQLEVVALLTEIDQVRVRTAVPVR